VPGNDSEKTVSFKFLFKCRQCHWWRHFWRKTVPGFCHRNTTICHYDILQCIFNYTAAKDDNSLRYHINCAMIEKYQKHDSKCHIIPHTYKTVWLWF